MTGTDVLFTNEYQVRQMLKNGIHYREIGKEFGVSKDVVTYFCKLTGLSRGANKNSEEDAARKIRDKSNGLLEYVSGYTIKEKPVKVRCLVCGGEFERTFHNLTTKGGVTCPHCVKREREAKLIKQDCERAERKRKADINKIRNSKQIRLVICASCGEVFTTWSSKRVYCSKECCKRSNMKTQGSDDRLNKSNIIDKDITLDKLFIRDKGICQICGGRCDYNDYRYNKNGTFIAGESYPSKDHIVELCNGGKHSWENISLAHRGCNSKLFLERKRHPSRSVENDAQP